MSRGPGWVQKEILNIFQQAEHPAFKTSELCEIIYKTRYVEKKHRVAVIRALRKLAEGPLPGLWKWTLDYEKADTVWFDHRHLPLKGKSREPVNANRRRRLASPTSSP